jgi:hypothetical protein
MNALRATLLVGSLGALLAASASDASAQVEVGIHGTLADVRDISPGLGGRVSFMRPNPRGISVGVELSGTYYFPSCREIEDCSAWGGQAMLMGRRAVTANAQPYLGIGAKYVEATFDDGAGSATGDTWGLEVLIGSTFRPDQRVVPFFEFGWGFMDSRADIWELTLGLRASLGGR